MTTPVRKLACRLTGLGNCMSAIFPLTCKNTKSKRNSKGNYLILDFMDRCRMWKLSEKTIRGCLLKNLITDLCRCTILNKRTLRYRVFSKELKKLGWFLHWTKNNNKILWISNRVLRRMKTTHLFKKIRVWQISMSWWGSCLLEIWPRIVAKKIWLIIWASMAKLRISIFFRNYRPLLLSGSKKLILPLRPSIIKKLWICCWIALIWRLCSQTTRR